MTCIIPNCYRTTLECDRAIGPTLNNLKWDIIWHIIFEGIIITKYEFIHNFPVVIKYFTIFADIIFIYLRLLFLAYLLPTRGIFYRENYITEKY